MNETIEAIHTFNLTHRNIDFLCVKKESKKRNIFLTHSQLCVFKRVKRLFKNAKAMFLCV